MSPFFRSIIATAFVLAAAGCANIEYKDYNAIHNEDLGGFVYYDDSPYLIVYPDGKGSVTWQVQYLPDQTKKRVAVPQNCMSSLNTSLTFQNGVLTQSSAAVDETEILKAVGTAIQTLGPLALAAAGNESPTTATIHVYKINVDGDTATFVPATSVDGSDGVSITVPLN